MDDKAIISPVSDYVFKRLFFDESSKDTILKKLLVDCIEFSDRQVDQITLLDRTIDKKHENEKIVILDVNVKLSDGTLVNVEVQKYNQTSFIERSIYYLAARISSQGKKGIEYSKLKSTISLNIVDFNLFKNTDEFYSRFMLSERDRHDILSNLVRIDFLELKKIDVSNIDNNDKKALWVKFFNAKTEGELNMIKNIDKTFEDSVEKLKRLNDEPRVLTEVQMIERHRRDEAGRIKFAAKQGHEDGLKEGLRVGHDVGHRIGHEEGHRIGHEEGLKDGQIEGRKVGVKDGRLEKQLEIVMRLLDKGFNDDEIVDLTGIGIDELNKLKS